MELPSPRSESYENRSTGIIAVVIGLLAGIPMTVGSIFGFRKWRRRRPRRCPACQTLMTRLGEADDDALLEGGQQAEERIGCHNRTKSSTETVVNPASTISSGSARVVETCAFCTFRREYTKVLPPIQPSGSSSNDSSSSGSSGGASSSFGGGGSGGGGASRGY